MIELKNASGEVIKVPSGARKLYETQGFRPVELEPVVEQEVDVHEESGRNDELLEKPISQWKKKEVIDFANANGIDLVGTKSINEAKSIIKKFLDEKSASEGWD